IADRIDGLMRGPRSDNNAPAYQRLRSSIQKTIDRCNDLQRLYHAALAGLAALGHLAFVGTNEANAILLECGPVPACGGMRPHTRVHGWSHKDRLVRCQ